MAKTIEISELANKLNPHINNQCFVDDFMIEEVIRKIKIQFQDSNPSMLHTMELRDADVLIAVKKKTGSGILRIKKGEYDISSNVEQATCRAKQIAFATGTRGIILS